MEANSALSISIDLDMFIDVGLASETDFAQAITPNVLLDYITPKHNMTLTVENRIMTLTIEDRIMEAQ